MALLMEKVSYQRLSSLLVEVTDCSFFTDSVWRQFIAGQSKGLTGTRLFTLSTSRPGIHIRCNLM